ncbi:MAG: DUF2892 domain-containing protein [Thiotrichales bacterium]|nr:DUF2892 domain-containing protein [Thiotrichales bacterium]
MSVPIKGNRPLRFFAMMVLVILLVAHFLKQVNLLELSFLWLIIAMALNAIQASFTGFCPMFKNARGECVACGVACNPSAQTVEKSDSACGSGCGCSASEDKKS